METSPRAARGALDEPRKLGQGRDQPRLDWRQPCALLWGDDACALGASASAGHVATRRVSCPKWGREQGSGPAAPSGQQGRVTASCWPRPEGDTSGASGGLGSLLETPRLHQSQCPQGGAVTGMVPRRQWIPAPPRPQQLSSSEKTEGTQVPAACSTQ